MNQEETKTYNALLSEVRKYTEDYHASKLMDCTRRLNEFVDAITKVNRLEKQVSQANGDLQEITLRVYKHELIDLISDLTYNNENFDPDEWSEFDGERLKKASDIILSHLSG